MMKKRCSRRHHGKRWETLSQRRCNRYATELTESLPSKPTLFWTVKHKTKELVLRAVLRVERLLRETKTQGHLGWRGTLHDGLRDALQVWNVEEGGGVAKASLYNVKDSNLAQL